MNKTKIFLATGNKKKIEEMKKIFSDDRVELLSINDGIKIPEVVEDGETFEENSAKKAREIAKFLNMITIADDSGLCVEALGGNPGIYSARFAGENSNDELNNKKLMEVMKDETNRRAKFVCVITLAKPTGEIYSFRGEIEGEITHERHGEKGFGYDPYFYVKEYDKTFAELDDVKSKISHRAIALNKLASNLQKIL